MGIMSELPHSFTGGGPWECCIFCGISRENVTSPICDKAIDFMSLRTKADFKNWNRVVNAAMGSFAKRTLVAKTAPQCQQ
jgi:hypothetical protein